MTSGYELSPEDFLALLSDSLWRPAVAPLLREWYRCEIVERGSSIVLVDADGLEHTPNELHATIQANRDQQFLLYQRAMTLWR